MPLLPSTPGSHLQETDSLLNAVPIRCFERARQQAQQLQRRGYPANPPPGYLYGERRDYVGGGV